MKIDKQKGKYLYHYYIGSRITRRIYHGLYCSSYRIGYYYHGRNKGFWIRREYWL